MKIHFQIGREFYHPFRYKMINRNNKNDAKQGTLSIQNKARIQWESEFGKPEYQKHLNNILLLVPFLDA